MDHVLSPAAYRDELANDRPIHGVSPFGSTTVHRAAPTPIIGTAMHHSHHIRDDIRPKLEIPADERYYEEDPETHRFIGSLLHTLLPNQSRYELDLNRSPDVTIYSRPDLAWGKKVYAEELTQAQTEATLEKWYEFHTLIDAAVEDAIRRFGYAIVFDIHSYNYQRDGPTDWRTDGKPVINLGTRYLQLDEPLAATKDWFMRELEGHTLLGEEILTQENAVFFGGYLNRRLSRIYGSRCMTLSVEYKKVFMNEREGKVLERELMDLVDQMDASIQRLGERLDAPVRDKPDVPRAATA